MNHIFGTNIFHQMYFLITFPNIKNPKVMILACLKVGPNLVVYHEFLRCTIVWKHPVLGENLIIGFGCIIISSHIQQYIPFETLISPYKYVYIYI